MLLFKARDLCPDLKIVPYEFEAFFSVAEDLYKTVAKLVKLLIRHVFFSSIDSNC